MLAADKAAPYRRERAVFPMSTRIVVFSAVGINVWRLRMVASGIRQISAWRVGASNWPMTKSSREPPLGFRTKGTTGPGTSVREIWRKMGVSGILRRKQLEEENAKLKRLVAA